MISVPVFTEINWCVVCGRVGGGHTVCTPSHFVWRVDDSHSARVARPLLVS